MGGRLALVIVVFGAAFGLLAFRMYELQIAKGGYYYARAATQDAARDFGDVRRGAIYFTDKNGNEVPAALDKDYPTIYAVPKEIDDVKEAANQIALLTGLSAADLEAKLAVKSPNIPLERKASDEDAAKIESADIKGIYTSISPSRYYPLGTLAAHLLGYVGPSAVSAADVGHYGVEELDNQLLSGALGENRDVTLTIDPNIQNEAERILDDLVKSQNSTGGSVIVEDPATGKILAMGSYPNFDPNDYSSSSLSSFLNPVVQKIYEPGSVMKVITMSAGIDSGKITPRTTYVDTGTLNVGGGYTISNYDLKTHGPYGRTDMTQVIAHSINTGAAFAERATGNAIFKSYLEKFGFTEKTGITLPGEVAGSLGDLGPKASVAHWATASYGQGVAVTPLEITNAFAAIANGGTLMRPYVDASLSPQAIRRVVSPETAEQVKAMMVNAVDEAHIAVISGYALGGKTGSAFIPDFKHGGYTDRLIDTYIGFGPASHPQFVAFLRIDNLPSSAIAALSVVPAFRELSQFIINYEGIAPDRLPPAASSQ